MRRRASGAPAPRPARCCRCSGGRQACPPATPCRSRARSPPFVAQPRRELDAEMPEPADAEDRHECPRSRAAVLQRVEVVTPAHISGAASSRGHVVRDPGKRRGGADQSVPPWAIESLWQMPHAWTFTRTSPWPGSGTSRSARSRAPPASWTSTTRMLIVCSAAQWPSVRARARTVRTRAGGIGAGSPCGPRRGRRGNGLGGWGRGRLTPPSPSLGFASSGACLIAHQTR